MLFRITEPSLQFHHKIPGEPHNTNWQCCWKWMHQQSMFRIRYTYVLGKQVCTQALRTEEAIFNLKPQKVWWNTVTADTGPVPQCHRLTINKNDLPEMKKCKSGAVKLDGNMSSGELMSLNCETLILLAQCISPSYRSKRLLSVAHTPTSLQSCCANWIWRW